MRKRLIGVLGLIAALLLARGEVVVARQHETVGPDPGTYRATVDRATAYLTANQAPDGSFSGHLGIGPTALATLGQLRTGGAPGEPSVAAGLKHLVEHVQPTGGIHAARTHIPVYETCVALVCLEQANDDGRYDEIIDRAEAFIRGGQWDEDRGKDRADLYYGGAGYGGQSRPDLSNTAFLVEALHSAGAEPNDEAIQKALVFVSRCQNLESEHNTTRFASKVNDGGFYYTCVLDRQSEERQTADGGLRSYGSMTYSGLKSLVHAGLTKDDPRLEAAVRWIREHYDVTSNPGMGDAGLYYYFHTFAKALDAMEVDRFEDADGLEHDWRRELAEELAGRQRDNGSWVNTNRRWMEGDPNLATSFALLALSYCPPKPAGAAR